MTFPLVNLLFPRRCEACGEFLNADADLCGDCVSAWPGLSESRCVVCAEPFESVDSLGRASESGPVHACGSCLTDPPAFDRLVAAGLYEGMLLELIVRFKYRGEERLSRVLGDRIADLALPGSASFDLILPIPLHPGRLRERGFNQAVLLARRIEKRAKTPVETLLLRKIRPTPPQAGLHGDERRKNLKGVFRISEEGKVRGKSVLLVDDVATTGATLHEAARVLRKAGAERVEAVVVAKAARPG